MLTQTQIDAFHRDGFVKAEGLFSPGEVQHLNAEMNAIIDEWWGEPSIGWRGPWREHYLEDGEQHSTRAVFIGAPHQYSAAWGQIIFHPGLVQCVQSLIGPNVQWHHTILHGKPPGLGTPFPMHQDYPFYPHTGEFLDCLVHLDDTPEERGCLRLVPGSHRLGPLEHREGDHTRPYLPPEQYHPDKVETVPIPAQAGDVVFFSYCTIHWSQANRSSSWRKSVRIGYHPPESRPIDLDPAIPNHNIMAGGFKQRQAEPRITYR